MNVTLTEFKRFLFVVALNVLISTLLCCCCLIYTAQVVDFTLRRTFCFVLLLSFFRTICDDKDIFLYCYALEFSEIFYSFDLLLYSYVYLFSNLFIYFDLALNCQTVLVMLS